MSCASGLGGGGGDCGGEGVGGVTDSILRVCVVVEPNRVESKVLWELGWGKIAFKGDGGEDEQDPSRETEALEADMMQGKGLESWTSDISHKYTSLVACPPLLFAQGPSDCLLESSLLGCGPLW